jgi:hypothetical protein
MSCGVAVATSKGTRMKELYEQMKLRRLRKRCPFCGSPVVFDQAADRVMLVHALANDCLIGQMPVPDRKEGGRWWNRRAGAMTHGKEKYGLLH